MILHCPIDNYLNIRSITARCWKRNLKRNRLGKAMGREWLSFILISMCIFIVGCTGSSEKKTMLAPVSTITQSPSEIPTPIPTSTKKPVSPTQSVEKDFLIAREGDYWEINDEMVAVTREPELYPNEEALLRGLVTIIGPGTKIEIVETKGILSQWKRVYVYNNKDELSATGWILGETVKEARRTKKGLFTP